MDFCSPSRYSGRCTKNHLSKSRLGIFGIMEEITWTSSCCLPLLPVEIRSTSPGHKYQLTPTPFTSLDHSLSSNLSPRHYYDSNGPADSQPQTAGGEDGRPAVCIGRGDETRLLLALAISCETACFSLGWVVVDIACRGQRPKIWTLANDRSSGLFFSWNEWLCRR